MRRTPTARILTLLALAISVPFLSLLGPSVSSAATGALVWNSYGVLPGVIAPGGTFTVRADVYNAGVTTRDAVVTATLDPGVTLLASNLPPDAGTTNRWTISGVAGAATTPQLRLELQTAPDLVTGATVGAVLNVVDQFGGTVAPIHPTATIQPGGPTGALVWNNYRVLPGEIAPGGTFTVRADVYNAGVATRDAVVTATLDPGVTLLASNLPPDAGTTNQWTISGVAGAATTPELRLELQTAPDLVTGAIVGAVLNVVDQFGGTVAPIHPTATIQPGGPTGALVWNSYGVLPGVIAPGGTFTVRADVYNAGVATRDAVVTATLDPGVTLLASNLPPDAGTTNQWTISGVAGAATTPQLRLELQTASDLVAGATVGAVLNVVDQFGGTVAPIHPTATIQPGGPTGALVWNSYGVLPGVIAPGGTFTVRADVYNAGVATRDAVVTATLDPGVTLLASNLPPDAGTTNQWTISGVAGAATTPQLRLELQTASDLVAGATVGAVLNVVDQFGGTVAPIHPTATIQVPVGTTTTTTASTTIPTTSTASSTTATGSSTTATSTTATTTASSTATTTTLCNDGDVDGVCDQTDNCVDFPNPSQADLDRDGLGDACDPSDATVTLTLGNVSATAPGRGVISVRGSFVAAATFSVSSGVAVQVHDGSGLDRTVAFATTECVTTAKGAIHCRWADRRAKLDFRPAGEAGGYRFRFNVRGLTLQPPFQGALSVDVAEGAIVTGIDHVGTVSLCETSRTGLRCRP